MAVPKDFIQKTTASLSYLRYQSGGKGLLNDTDSLRMEFQGTDGPNLEKALEVLKAQSTAFPPYVLFFTRTRNTIRVEAANGMAPADLMEAHLEKAQALEAWLCEVAEALGLAPAKPQP